MGIKHRHRQYGNLVLWVLLAYQQAGFPASRCERRNISWKQLQTFWQRSCSSNTMAGSNTWPHTLEFKNYVSLTLVTDSTDITNSCTPHHKIIIISTNNKVTGIQNTLPNSIFICSGHRPRLAICDRLLLHINELTRWHTHSGKCNWAAAQCETDSKHIDKAVADSMAAEGEAIIHLNRWKYFEINFFVVDWLIEQGLTSHQTHYRSYRGRFLQVI